MQRPFFASWPHAICLAVLCVALLMAGPAAVQAQGNDNSVPLTLNYHEDVAAEGTLPEGTEVVVWDEQAAAQTLSSWGGREAMKDSLTDRSVQLFARVYDRVDTEGQTRWISIVGDGNTAAYVLARVPDDAEESHRFYESRRAYEAGLDVVQTGTMEMIAVEGDDAAWAQNVFAAITSEEVVSPEDSDSGWLQGGIIWSVYGMLVILVFLLLQASKAEGEKSKDHAGRDKKEEKPQFQKALKLESSEKELSKKEKKRNRRRQKGRMKRSWDAVLSSSDKKSKPVEESPAQGSGEGKKGVSSKQKSQEIVAGEREDDMPKGEVIAELREEVKELKEKVRKRDARTREQMNTKPETSPADAEDEALSQGLESEQESERLQETVADLKIMLSKKNDALEAKDKKLKQALEVVQAGQENEEEQETTALAQQMAALGAENRRLQKMVNALKAKQSTLPEAAQATPESTDRATSPAHEDPSEPVDAAYAETQEALGDAFRTWCQQGRVMVGRYYMFERAVQDAYPDATVSPIYHTPEADTPFQFTERRAVATFWLVEINGASFLLPVPRRDGTFEALEPAVPAHDNANPAELVHATPARVVATGMGYQVEEVGQFAFEASVSSSG